MENFNQMQTVKRRLFAMRNGVIADALRKGGSKYRIIFGLNLPQLVDIAREFGPDPQLARALWDNSTTRESRLLAPMLMEPTATPRDAAIGMARQIDDIETADIFCHRFLRRHPQAVEMLDELLADDAPMTRYVGLRLAFNLVASIPAKAKEAAQANLASSIGSIRSIAAALAAEADFYLE